MNRLRSWLLLAVLLALGTSSPVQADGARIPADTEQGVTTGSRFIALDLLGESTVEWRSATESQSNQGRGRRSCNATQSVDRPGSSAREQLSRLWAIRTPAQRRAGFCSTLTTAVPPPHTIR